MPEPLSVHQRRVDRLERQLRMEHRIIALAVVVFTLFVVTLLACPALAIWSSLRGWDAGTACTALFFTGLAGTFITGIIGVGYYTDADPDTHTDLDRARDDYDHAVEQAVRDAR